MGSDIDVALFETMFWLPPGAPETASPPHHGPNWLTYTATTSAPCSQRWQTPTSPDTLLVHSNAAI